jgi:PAS domain S-box-containing protein
MSKLNLPSADVIVDSLNDGLYVCDKDRRILYWSKSAERITGWTPEDVVGHRCLDNILCHVDKDGRRLCGEDFCPLHRSMVTDKASTCPVIVFGQTKAGGRVPMVVSVAPMHDADGQVVGGVECFHDFSETYTDLELAKRIQTLALEKNLPKDSRVGFATFYVPHDMIGGDYFSIRKLDDDHYGFLLADVMGHGVSAALHTMHLSALWERHCPALLQPVAFAQALNRDLCQVVKDESFATAICGVIDAAKKTVRFASAGGPPVVLSHADGSNAQLAVPGLPFGMFEGADYRERELDCGPGDRLLMFTDGAIEIHNADGAMLNIEGLMAILDTLDYPRSDIEIESLQKALLNYSDGIRLDDDLTLLEVRFF